MSSAVSPFFNLLYLLSLPSSAEQIKGIEKLAENEKTLMKKIFKKDVYDSSLPSDSPTLVLPFMFIDHIEELDQKEQIMNMHCSVLFHWTDSRIMWEPKDYGNVDRITRPKSDFARMWFPPVHFTEMRMRSDQAMQYYNTDVTILSNGAIYAQVSLSIASTCFFDFSNYPKDEQICHLTMFTSLPMSRLKFSRWTSLTKRSDIFGKDLDGNKFIRTGEFMVTDSSAMPLFILPLGKITNNETAAPAEMMRSIVRFEIKFRRAITHYVIVIALPIFALSAISYMAAVVVSCTTSVIWLLMCIVVQLMNYAQIVEQLPPDHLSSPLCAKMATLVLAETFTLLVCRVALTYHYARCSGDACRLAALRNVELALRVSLAAHCFLNALILFVL